jgi:hypothetical protein
VAQVFDGRKRLLPLKEFMPIRSHWLTSGMRGLERARERIDCHRLKLPDKKLLETGARLSQHKTDLIGAGLVEHGK